MQLHRDWLLVHCLQPSRADAKEPLGPGSREMGKSAVSTQPGSHGAVVGGWEA